ncbi:MAG: glycosyltransferase family 4 protein [Alphaproteobacteria bacterium]|nr:MAG: glycosyltransferase family 4 protein [Alphaproteobacteria bacterium]
MTDGTQHKTLALVGTTAASMLTFRGAYIQALVAQGWRVLVLCCDYTTDTANQVRALGADPIFYPLARTGMNPFRDCYTLWFLYVFMRRWRPHVVLSFFTKPVIYGTLAACFAGVPRIATLLEGLGYAFTDLPHEKKPFVVRFIRAIQVALYRLSLPRAHVCFFLNKDDPQDLLARYKISVKSYDVLGPIGVDCKKFSFSPPITKPLTFLFVGRLLKEKGIHEFVAAATRVKNQYPHVQFQIAGEPDSANPGSLTHETFVALRKSSTISFLGYVTDMPAVYAQASALVLPSYREGYSLSVQEAMASGRLVITSDAPGCKGTVLPGFTGSMVRTGSVDDLVSAIVTYVKNPEFVGEQGKNARTYAEKHYDIQATTAMLIAKTIPSKG